MLRAIGLALVVGSALVTGCAAPAEDASDSAAAFTVASGARFVVSAKPEKVVFRREVDGVKFPFDEASLVGKAILVHPIPGRSETGVYSRAKSIVTKGDRYEITAEPLSLEQMAALSEDEIVRVFIDPKSEQQHFAGATLEARSVDVLDPGFGFRGTDLNSFNMDGFNLAGGIDFGKPAMLRPGVAFSNTVERASFVPEVLLSYTDAGLDVGFRGSLSWSSTFAISGMISGDFYRSPALKTPPAVVFVPIGWVPVPVTIRGVASVFCSVSVTGPADLQVKLTANARVGGSLRFKASLDKPVQGGPWKAEASGSAGMTPRIGGTFGAGLECELPRVEVHADVVGIVGPYVAASLVAGLDTEEGPSVAARLKAGFGTGLAEGVPSPEIGIYEKVWPVTF